VAAAVAPQHADIGALAAGPVADHVVGGSTIVPGAPVGSFGGSTSITDPILDAVVDGATNPAVILVGTAVTLAGISAVTRGFGLAGASGGAQLLFTNVRLIPCLAVDSVAQTVSQVGSTATRLGGRALPRPRAAAPLGPGVGAGGPAVGALPAVPAGAIDKGGRLMARLGIALAALYAAFLTTWLGTTRLRWKARV
jgi:hypothetical protein